MAKNMKTPRDVKLSGKKVKITLFYDGSDKYSAPLFVGLNGKTWLIKRGEEVEVPVEVYEVIKHQMDQDRNASQLISAYASEFQEAEAEM